MGMKPGMKMLAMAKASKESPDRQRMGNDHSTHMGGYDREMNDQPEMRRRRDSRGRFMEGGEMARMAYDGGNEMAYRAEAEPSRMRDSNVVHIRDYQDKRLIGFGMAGENEMEGDMRQYGRRYDPNRMTASHGQRKPYEMGGAEGEEDGEHLTREKAEKWAKSMKSEDGKPGPRWPYNEIKQYAANFGVQGDEVVDFFAIMNALYSDYCKVAKKYGVDKVDFWADLAKAFMHDKDAVPDKVMAYYECIAKHDD